MEHQILVSYTCNKSHLCPFASLDKQECTDELPDIESPGCKTYQEYLKRFK